MVSILRKTKLKLKLLTDIYMPLMIEKVISGGICHAIHRYVKAYNKYMKKYDKNKEKEFVRICNVTKVICWWFLVD